MSSTPRLVLITGAGSGIGRATALAFGAQEAMVMVTDIDLDSAKETVELVRAAGGKAEAHRLDVTDLDAWNELAGTVQTAHGTPDVVVNNAGYMALGSFFKHGVDDWERLLAVNVYGVINGCRVFGSEMIDAGVKGHIVNVASIAAYLPSPEGAAYCTTKAAVKMFSECLRLELAPHGIGVTALCPGAIDTGLVAATHYMGVEGQSDEERDAFNLKIDARLMSGPDVVARAVVKAVRHNHADVPVPAASRAAYALSRVSPGATRTVARLATSDVMAHPTKILPAPLRRWLDKADSR